MSLTVKFAQSLESSALEEIRESLRHDAECFARVLEVLPDKPTTISARARVRLGLDEINRELSIADAEHARRSQLTF